MPTVFCNDGIWVSTRKNNFVPMKLNILMWRVAINGISILCESLNGMSVNLDYIMCPLCDDATKNASHVFFTCPLTIWILNEYLCVVHDKII